MGNTCIPVVDYVEFKNKIKFKIFKKKKKRGNNFRYADGTTLMAQSEEELKNLLMKVEEKNKKVGLKLNIPKMKIMAFSPIISWQIDGETMETVRDFFSWAPKSL